MRYEYFTVHKGDNGFTIADDTGLILSGHTISSAFNVLGKMGAQLKIQTKAGVFVFEREVVEMYPGKGVEMYELRGANNDN